MLSMANQGSEHMAAVDPNSMENHSVNEVSQRHAPVNSGHYSWPTSAGQVAGSWNYGRNSGPLENATSSSSVNHYDPLRDSTCSEGAHFLTNPASQTSAASNLSATTGSPAYAGYVPYSSSTYAYGYDNMQYQSNYYSHPQQASYTSYQQAGTSQNSGASYQPHSSFQNTGSYATPTSYSSAYFASDQQTVAGYLTSGYGNQTNYWNERNGGDYPVQYANYPSLDSNSATSASNPAISSYPYQQECNQWSVNYGASVSNVNCTSESGSKVASNIPKATYPIQSTSGSYLYASRQPPPPGTISWRGDLGVPTLPSSQEQNDAIASFPNGSWKEKALPVQNYHLNQKPLDLQKPLNLKLPLYENHDANGKTACSYGPTSSLQIFSNEQECRRAMRLRSSLTRETIRVWRSRFHIPADVEILIPTIEQRAQSPPEGWMTLSEPSLRAGFRLPPCDEVKDILKFCAAPPSRFTLLGMLRIMGLISFFREHGSVFSLELFKDWCELRDDKGGRVEVHSNKAWLIFESRSDKRNVNTVYGYVRNSWDLPSVWRPLPDRCRRVRGREHEFLPLLGFSEPHEMAAYLLKISLYVDEKRLMLRGLSFDPERATAAPLGQGRKRLVILEGREDSTSARRLAGSQKRRPKGDAACSPRVEAEALEEDLDVNIMGSTAPRAGGGEAGKTLVATRELPIPPLGDDMANAQSRAVVPWSTHLATFKEDFQTLQEKLSTHLATLGDDFQILQGKLKRAQSEYATLREKRSRDLSEFRQVETGFKAEISDLRGEIDHLKAEVARLSSAEHDEELMVAGLARYKTSVDFLKDQDVLTQIVRNEVWDLEMEPELLDVRKRSFGRGMAKALRLMARRHGCDIEDVTPSDLSEDEDLGDDEE